MAVVDVSAEDTLTASLITGTVDDISNMLLLTTVDVWLATLDCVAANVTTSLTTVNGELTLSMLDGVTTDVSESLELNANVVFKLGCTAGTCTVVSNSGCKIVAD